MATVTLKPTLLRMPTAAGSSPASERVAGAEKRRSRHVAPAILTMLQQGPCHGYGLMRRLPTLLARPEDRPSPSVFYRILKGLDSEGAVRSSIGISEGAPRRRLYELTPAGRRLLESWRVLLRADLETINTVLAASDAGRTTRGDGNPRRRAPHEIAD